MKKIQAIFIALLMLTLTKPANCQGWNQDKSGIYSIGVGGTQVLAIGPGYSYISSGGFSLNVSGEYRIHRFIGLGFETGIDAFVGPYPPYFVYGDYRYPAVYSAIGIPIAMKVNIHILEAADVPIADRLDVYAGLNAGGGPAFYTGPGGGVYGFLLAGPQIGIRYWLNRNIGVFGEFGWGATFANVGLTF